MCPAVAAERRSVGYSAAAPVAPLCEDPAADRAVHDTRAHCAVAVRALRAGGHLATHRWGPVSRWLLRRRWTVYRCRRRCAIGRRRPVDRRWRAIHGWLGLHGWRGCLFLRYDEIDDHDDYDDEHYGQGYTSKCADRFQGDYSDDEPEYQQEDDQADDVLYYAKRTPARTIVSRPIVWAGTAKARAPSPDPDA
jgi:hypothetical protein